MTQKEGIAKAMSFGELVKMGIEKGYTPDYVTKVVSGKIVQTKEVRRHVCPLCAANLREKLITKKKLEFGHEDTDVITDEVVALWDKAMASIDILSKVASSTCVIFRHPDKPTMAVCTCGRWKKG